MVLGSRTGGQAGSMSICDRPEGEGRVSAGLDTQGSSTSLHWVCGQIRQVTAVTPHPQLDSPRSLLSFLSRSGLASVISEQPQESLLCRPDFLPVLGTP